jgi:hypothetical protein
MDGFSGIWLLVPLFLLIYFILERTSRGRRYHARLLAESLKRNDPRNPLRDPV